MIRKAVIPAAGFGTRFLPASKSQPKEMLPIVDTPTIQYVVEEAAASGITDILIIIGKGKRAIEEHFDRNFELEAELEASGKREELHAMRRISDLANIYFVWQKELSGLGNAITYARDHVGKEPFAVLLGDTLIASQPPATSQLINIFERYQESVVVLEEVDPKKVERYGIIKGHEIDDRLLLAEDFIEKPSMEEAPSNLAIAGRYIFTPEIFDYLDRITPGKNGELQLTDAMRLMVAERAMYGLCIEGERFDIGNKLDFLKTNIAFGLNHPEIGKHLRAYIKDLATEL
ncbi:MAG: UTP--glucose-1-phosphate uridylyltransferase GalU [Planctomycetes bacterium]|nr:UTP--glucose-1-phosphate uridylyltransferase GalU [Planctomycetota bacterium]